MRPGSAYAEKTFLIDYADPKAIESRGKELVGLTFRDVLSLGIFPPDATEEERSKDYSRKSYKGGVGNLIEERFYGYQANSESDADFAEAGVELKTTCYDVKKDGGQFAVLALVPDEDAAVMSGVADHGLYRVHNEYAARSRNWRRGLLGCRIARIGGLWYMVSLLPLHDNGGDPSRPDPDGEHFLDLVRKVLGVDGEFAQSVYVRRED